MINSKLKYFYPLIFITFLLSSLVLPTKALCQLSAETELNYINYDVRDNSNQHLSSHSLTQRYSVLYQSEGKIMDNRLGKYKLALGYDWATFDTTIKSTNAGTENPQGSRGHILYRGEVLIDPKEIPFRLTAYSRDMSRTSFTQDSTSQATSINNSSTFSLTSPLLATGIQDGTHINSGATLVMGIKNGMTNGYNEILRHFPMLMLDFRDSINRDLKSTSPVNDRLSRLAFVSLNKKDNWFHYRLITYHDYINPDNNYKETQIQLGTVDQTMERRWIDFSNWLSVSADGQLTTRTSAQATSSIDTDSHTEFDLNLFGIAQRSSWEARTFNNFNRNKEDNGIITYRTTIPVYANGSLSADTSWNTRFSYKDDHDNLNNKFSDVAGGYRIDTFKRSSFTLSQQLDLEKATTNNNEMLTVSAALETTSTSRFSRTVGLAASYNIRDYMYETPAKTNFLDQTLRATATYSPSNQTRWMLSQANRLTNGTSQFIYSDLQGSSVTSTQYYNPRNGSNVSGSTFQSTTALSFFWNPLARLNAGFTIDEDIYIPQNALRSYLTKITTTTDYTGTNFKLTSRNALSIESNKEREDANLFTSYNRADYTFNRNLDTHVSLTYSKVINSIDQNNQSNTLSYEQGLNYYYYKSGGISSKLFEINETIDHSESNGVVTTSNYYNNTARTRTNNFSLGAKYYPIRQLILAAGTKYTFFNSFNDSALTYFGSLGLNYKLLQASLDYVYGTVKADGRVEKKLTANFRKIF